MPGARSLRSIRTAARACALALGTAIALLVAIGVVGAGTAAAHDGHPHGPAVLVGPPAPDWVWRGAEQARNASERARFGEVLDAAPAEVDGRCEETAAFTGVGRGCRTAEGLLRVTLPGGGDLVTHGPDFVESSTDIDPETTAPYVAAAVQRATKADVACVDPSTPHTQLVYAIPADGADRSAEKSEAFRQATYEASAVIDTAARRLSDGTAGRRLRVACNGSQEPTVLVMRLPRTSTTATFSTVQTDVRAAYGTGEATKVRYLVYYDAHLGGFGGIASYYDDTTATSANNNNMQQATALQDNSSGTGPNWFILLHELSHNMGAVQDGADDSNMVSHCNDGRDVMCYAEGGASGTYTDTECPELEYDCDSDSYFNPEPSGWLATNWNAAATYNRYLATYTGATDVTAPAAPTDLVAQPFGTFIRLTWTGVGDADLHTYRVERKVGADWVTMDDSWLGATTVDVATTAATTYDLRVRAYDRLGQLGDPSNVETLSSGAWTPSTRVMGGPALLAPRNVAVSSTTDTTATLTWEHSEGAHDWYIVERSATGAAPWTYVDYSYGTTLTDAGPLTASTTYTYRVRAEDAYGRRSSDVTAVGVTQVPGDLAAPDAPTGLAVQSSVGTTATIGWSAVAGASDYVVSVETDTPGSYAQQAIVTATSHTVTGLPWGATRGIRVAARDQAGNVSANATTSHTTGAAPDTQPPTDPNLISYSGVGFRSINGLSWAVETDNVAVVGYRLMYAPDASPHDYVLFATMANPATTTITGLRPGTAYRLEIEAYDAAGNTSRSGWYTISTTADPTAPTQPGAATASAVTATSMTLNWGASSDAQSGIEGYHVYRTNPGGTELLATTASLSTPITGLAPSTNYSFEVKAFDYAGNESSARTVAAATLAAADPTPPTPATNLRASNVLATSMRIDWDAAGDNVAVTGYELERHDGSTWVLVGTRTSDLFRNVTGLASGPIHTFRVRAFDAAGNASTSAELEQATPDEVAPSAPTNLGSSSVTGSSFTVSWMASTDNMGSIDFYEVLVDGVLHDSPTGTSTSITGLDDGVQYAVVVRAIDLAGNVSAHATIQVTTLDVTAPLPATGLGATNVTSSGMRVTWSAGSDNVAVTGYELERFDGAGWVLVGARSTALFRDVTGLPSGPTQQYRVQAFDAVGLSAVSGTYARATLDDVAPSQPAGLAATNVTGDSFDLSWSPSTDNVAVDHYEVRIDGALHSSPTGTSATITGREDDTDHVVTVRAVDAANNGATSASITVTTLDETAPGTPLSLLAPSAGDTTIALTWLPPLGGLDVDDEFRVYLQGDPTPLAQLGPATLTYTATGLTASTSYTFEVTTVDAVGNESAPASVTRSTAAAPDVTAPTGVSFGATTNITSSSFRLTWPAAVDAGGVAGYDLERQLADLSWTTVASGTTGLSFDVTGLATSTSYTFRLSAVDASGNRSTWATITVATIAGADTTPPSTPGAATGSGTDAGVVSLSWGAATDNSGVVDHYRVSRLTGAGYIAQGTTTTTSITLTSQPVGSHTYAISAVDAAGFVSSPRTTIVDVPAPPAPPTPPPAAPSAQPVSGLAASSTSTSITLSWQQAAGTATSWLVSERRGGVLASTRRTTTTSATYGPYAPNTSVQFEVVAVLGDSTSAPATLDVRTAADTVKPSLPTRAKATSPAPGTLLVTWRASRDAVKLGGYELKLTTKGARPKIVKLPARALKVKVVKLKRRAAYVVQLRSRDAAGNYSAWVKVKAPRTR